MKKISIIIAFLGFGITLNAQEETKRERIYDREVTIIHATNESTGLDFYWLGGQNAKYKYITDIVSYVFKDKSELVIFLENGLSLNKNDSFKSKNGVIIDNLTGSTIVITEDWDSYLRTNKRGIKKMIEALNN